MARNSVLYLALGLLLCQDALAGKCASGFISFPSVLLGKDVYFVTSDSATGYCRLRGFSKAGGVRTTTLQALGLSMHALHLWPQRVERSGSTAILLAVECLKPGQHACTADDAGNVGFNNKGSNNFGNGNIGSGNIEESTSHSQEESTSYSQEESTSHSQEEPAPPPQDEPTSLPQEDPPSPPQKEPTPLTKGKPASAATIAVTNISSITPSSITLTKPTSNLPSQPAASQPPSQAPSQPAASQPPSQPAASQPATPQPTP
ncbi:hypothetical protein ACKKBG_A09795 [Auxenochlorella protothecoides x Auxenochlorella symbiontica]